MAQAAPAHPVGQVQADALVAPDAVVVRLPAHAVHTALPAAALYVPFAQAASYAVRHHSPTVEQRPIQSAVASTASQTDAGAAVETAEARNAHAGRELVGAKRQGRGACRTLRAGLVSRRRLVLSHLTVCMSEGAIECGHTEGRSV